MYLTFKQSSINFLFLRLFGGQFFWQISKKLVFSDKTKHFKDGSWPNLQKCLPRFFVICDLNTFELVYHHFIWYLRLKTRILSNFVWKSSRVFTSHFIRRFIPDHNTVCTIWTIL